jgi:hypothetical protein
MTSKILSATLIATIGVILLAWAPTANAGNNVGTFDIKPGSCPNPINLNNHGLIPVAILGNAGFDVTTIDTTDWENAGWRPTIEDVGTPFFGPLVSIMSCNEFGPDGFDDIILKIPSSAFVIPSICLADDGQGAILGVTITLEDGTQFNAFDVATLLKKSNTDCPTT